MKIKDLIPVIEGQIEHLIVGTETEGVLAESKKSPYCDSEFPNCDSVENFLNRFKKREVSYIIPMDSSFLEIVIK